MERSRRPVHLVPRSVLAAIRADARAAAPAEACGILIGRSDGERTKTLEAAPGRNLETDRRRDRYSLAPGDFLRAERSSRARGLAVTGFWHSHPRSPPLPSASDHEEAWEGYSYLIVSLVERGDGAVRSFRLGGGSLEEEELRVSS